AVSTVPGGGCQVAVRTPFELIGDVLTLAYQVTVQLDPIGIVGPAWDGPLVVASVAWPPTQSTWMLSVTSATWTLLSKMLWLISVHWSGGPGLPAKLPPPRIPSA